MFDNRTLVLALALVAAGCPGPRTTKPRVAPTPTLHVGSCGDPGRDGVISGSPKLDRADRDLDGDGNAETIVVDRTMCTHEGNCYWNVFVRAPTGSQMCVRYVGTFEAAALELLKSKGDDSMADVRGYWNLHGGRLLLQSYRFMRGGYRIVDALQCRRAADDRLDCVDSER